MMNFVTMIKEAKFSCQKAIKKIMYDGIERKNRFQLSCHLKKKKTYFSPSLNHILRGNI